MGMDATVMDVMAIVGDPMAPAAGMARAMAIVAPVEATNNYSSFLHLLSKKKSNLFKERRVLIK